MQETTTKFINLHDRPFIDEALVRADVNLVYNKEVPIIENRDKYDICIPVITDIHILPTEPVNRNGKMIERGLQILDEISALIETNRCTGVIFTGDITDRGFNKGELNYETKIISRIARISRAVKGNCFSVLGNHEVTYAKNNLFYTFSSIDSDIIRQEIAGKTVPELIHPFIRTPNCLNFGDLKIHLLHYQKNAKKYKVMTQTTPINIAIYHDDLITFESKEELYHHKIGMGINILDTDIFENVDWAILGHIHTPLNTFELDNLRHTVVDNPGSMLSRTITEKHTEVKIPFICINSEGLSREYVRFSIGEYDETVNKKRVKKEKQQREMAKIMKKEKLNTNWEDYSTFLSGIKDENIREMVAISDKAITLKSTQLRNVFKEEHSY